MNVGATDERGEATTLAHGPTVSARREADQLAKAPCTVALIGEPDRERDLRQRKLRAGNELLRPLDPALKQVTVRRNTLGLLEGAREMKNREADDIRQRLDRDVLLEVRRDVFLHSAQRSRRQPTTRLEGSQIRRFARH